MSNTKSRSTTAKAGKTARPGGFSSSGVRARREDVTLAAPGEAVQEHAAEPLTRRKLRRLADGVNDLAERIQTVGLTEGTRGDVNRIRLSVCHYLRWAGLREGSGHPWAGEAKDLLLKALSPLNWCFVNTGAKHTDAEIVAALRRLSARMAKVAGSESEPAEDRGWTPAEAAEIVAGLRTLAAVVDCEPMGFHARGLAARIHGDLSRVYGALCSEETSTGSYVERTPEGDKADLAGLAGSGVNLLTQIEQHATPDDAGHKLRTAADAMEAAFADLTPNEPAEVAPADDESAESGTERKPLGRIAAVIYEKLKSLPEHRGMDTPALLAWLADRKAAEAEGRDIEILDDGTLRGHLKQIKPYGLRNAPKIGYYVR